MKHEWTVEVAARLTPAQARSLAAGGEVRVAIVRPKNEIIHCRRCWSPFSDRIADNECGAASAKKGAKES